MTFSFQTIFAHKPITDFMSLLNMEEHTVSRHSTSFCLELLQYFTALQLEDLILDIYTWTLLYGAKITSLSKTDKQKHGH